jgi:hypothetical protein
MLSNIHLHHNIAQNHTKNMLFQRPYLFLLGLALLFSACIKDNSPSIPAYVHIENIFFEADTSLGQGSSSSAITDAWPSVDGQLLGTNNLGATFPVILDPNIPTNALRISAGIKENGVGNTRIIYPFYEPYVEIISLQAGQIDTFRPTLHYDTSATIIVLEDFENPSQLIFTDDQDGNPNTELIHQNQEVFEGNYSGLMLLDSANLDCTVATSTHFYDLQPTATAFPVYLELNYKTNTPFQIGIIAYYPSGSSEFIYKGGGNANDSWKKIYFNLTDEVYSSSANEFAVVLRALKYPNTQQPLIYLDNIKLLHF